MHFWHKNVYDNFPATSSSSTCVYSRTILKVLQLYRTVHALALTLFMAFGSLVQFVARLIVVRCTCIIYAVQYQMHSCQPANFIYSADTNTQANTILLIQCQCLLMQNKIHLLAQKNIARRVLKRFFQIRNDKCPNSCIGGCVVYVFADMTNNCLNKASKTSRFIVQVRCIFYTISLV